MPILFYFCQILFFKFCYDFHNTTKKNGSGIMLWCCCRCHHHNLSSNRLIILNFEHIHSWQWIKVGIDLGYCNPTCFQTRGPKAHTTTKKFNLTDPSSEFWTQWFLALKKWAGFKLTTLVVQWYKSNYHMITTMTQIKMKGLGGSMSWVVGLPNNSYKPITNTGWVRARLCNLQKGCTRIAAASEW